MKVVVHIVNKDFEEIERQVYEDVYVAKIEWDFYQLATRDGFIENPIDYPSYIQVLEERRF